MPFVLISALAINTLLRYYSLDASLYRIVFLSASFPIGLSLGRVIYLRYAHVRIPFDDESFRVIKGSREAEGGTWRSFRYVSILLDRYGRPNLRLYKTMDGEHVDLPISKTNAKPQEFRDFVQNMLTSQKSNRLIPRVVEAS